VIAGIALSVGLVAVTPWIWRRRGVADGLRWLAIAVVPGALAMSGMARMIGRIGVEIGRFFTGFAFSPVVWAGFLLLGAAVALEVTSRAMRARGIGGAPDSGSGKSAAGGGSAAQPRQIEPSRGAPAPAPVDDDLAEIEELLRRRGIT
jgi:hypothetical protein